MPFNPDAKLVPDLAASPRLLQRDGFGKGIVEAAEKDERIVALTADLSESTRLNYFEQRFPDRFFDCGVAEQAMVTVASGLAAMGKIPFTTDYGAFSPGRNWEQVRTTICLNEQPVKIVSSHSGLSVGPDGATHQILEDITLTRVLPHMTVLSPCDYEEARKATLAAAAHPGPVYLRLSREKLPSITTPATPFEVGRAEVFREGSDCAILATGPPLYDALLAAEKLASQGINCAVLDIHTIKPLDEGELVNYAKKCGALVTVEDHQIAGGLGGAVAELLSEKYAAPLERVGMRDSFGESGPATQLYEKYGISQQGIEAAAKKAVARRH